MEKKLALHGGSPVITEPFPVFQSQGKEELEAATEVIKRGTLSSFIGSWGDHFYGGKEVRELEEAWRRYFDVKYAISVNSATSALIAAMGALDLEPGDEVIVSPWTMCATATAVLVWNAIPIFADIEPETFNLDPVSVEKNISDRTRAILVTDIFGHSANVDVLRRIADKHKLKLIEDSSQSPGAMHGGKYVGTNSDVGIFSLNYHKHIQTGEGGVCVTNDKTLAERMQLIRNHAEAVVEDKGEKNLANMVGFNFRMGEIEAAMAKEQLKKLKAIADSRIKAADRLTAGLAGLKGLSLPVVKSTDTHVYYMYPLILDEKATGVSRKKIVEALKAEGVPSISEGYVNVHRYPMYQKKIAYGTKGFPWTHGVSRDGISYEKGICPVAERMHDKQFFKIHLCAHTFDNKQVDLVIEAFKKVWANLNSIKG